jgi:septum formation protein
MQELILASTSRYRRALLQRLGLPFAVVAPEVDETMQAGETPAQLVRRLAEAKARAAAPRYPRALIIGSDQVAVLDGEVLGKPGDHARAVQQLRRSSGRRLTLLTGLCLFNSANGGVQLCVEPYSVVFRVLTEERIESYLRREQPYDCGGSVKSEGLGTALLRRHEGEDPTALVGLPLIRLVEMLENAGVAVL